MFKQQMQKRSLILIIKLWVKWNFKSNELTFVNQNYHERKNEDKKLLTETFLITSLCNTFLHFTKSFIAFIKSSEIQKRFLRGCTEMYFDHIIADNWLYSYYEAYGNNLEV